MAIGHARAGEGAGEGWVGGVAYCHEVGGVHGERRKVRVACEAEGRRVRVAHLQSHARCEQWAASGLQWAAQLLAQDPVRTSVSSGF
jgi:hypothetical protein